MPSTVAAERGAKLANICRFRSVHAPFLRTDAMPETRYFSLTGAL
jgi:hypothetical protein